MRRHALPYTVCTQDGELIALVTREQRNRLKGCTPEGKAPRYGSHGEPVFDQKLIEVHARRDDVYFALVDASVIKAELNREISASCPVAEDNRTVRRVEFSNEVGSGRYFEPHEAHCFAYPTTRNCLQDQIDRYFARERRSFAPSAPEIIRQSFPLTVRPA